MLVPLIGGAILGNLPRFGFPPIDPVLEVWYLRGYFAFALTAYMRWAFLVINRICAFLDINCLTIKSRQKQNGPAELGDASKESNGEVLRPRKRN